MNNNNSNPVYDRFIKCSEVLSKEVFLDEVFNYLSLDERQDFVENLEKNWEID